MFRSLMALLAILLIRFLGFGGDVLAQELSQNLFGKVSPEDFQPPSSEFINEDDTHIIFDLGSVMLTSNSMLTRGIFVHHRRFFVGEENDLRGKISVPVYTGQGEELLSIKAMTHKLNARGEVVSFRVEKRNFDIRSGEAPGENRVEFFFPFVEKGAIVEYELEIQTRKLFNLRTWYFQQDYPVVVSQFVTLVPEQFEYYRLVEGNTQGMVFNSDFLLWQRDPTLFEDGSAFYRNLPLSQSFQRGVPKDLYQMFYLRPIRKETFAGMVADHIPRVTLQILEGRGLPQNSDIFDNWARLNRKMLRHRQLGKQLGVSEPIGREAQKILRESGSMPKAIPNIYEFVRTQFEWDGTYQIFTDDLDATFRKRAGHSGEINLVLLDMLQEIGGQAHPVLISTKAHGRPQTLVPRVDQFNHLVVAVEDYQGDQVLLDATSAAPGFGTLPSDDLNGKGLKLLSEGPEWIILQAQNKLVRNTYSRLNLIPDGQLVGEFTFFSDNYSAFLEENRLRSYEGQTSDYIRDNLLGNVTQADIITTSVQMPENADDQLVVNCEVVIPDFAKKEGDYIVIKPMINKLLDVNPFQEEERMYPVDFTYPLRDSYMLGLRVPYGYEIDKLPEPIRVVLPNNGGSFTYNVLPMGDVVHFSSMIHLEKTLYAPEEYSLIRNFFQFVVEKHQEPLILRRITE